MFSRIPHHCTSHQLKAKQNNTTEAEATGFQMTCSTRGRKKKKIVSVCLHSLTHSNLVLCCDCVQPSVHAGTSNVPEGPQELSLIQLFRDLSYCRAERVKAFSLLQTPTFTVAQPSFTILSVLTKIDKIISGWTCSHDANHGTLGSSQALSDPFFFFIISNILELKLNATEYGLLL